MAKARPSSAEIDRFLEEVNRRKQQQAKRSAPPPVVQVQREQPKAKVQPPKPVRVQQRQIIIEEPVVRPPVAAVLLPEPPRDLSAQPATSAYQIPTAPPTLPRGAKSVAVQHAQAMIKSRDGLRAMLVVNEILSPPRCKRSYRR